jgi:hypothetical protein
MQPPPAPRGLAALFNALRLRAPSPAAPAGLKATLLDTLSWKQATLAAVAFFATVVITLIVGAAGPTAASTTSFAVSAPCAGACTAPLTVSLGQLTQYNQVTWLTARMRRPLLADGVTPAGLNSRVQFFLTWSLQSAAANGLPWAASGVNRTANIVCDPGMATCSPFLLFSQVITRPVTYDISIVVSDPLAAFRAFGGAVQPGVFFDLSQGTLNAEYTSFEAGFKIFYQVVTMILWLAYLVSLYRADGARSPVTGALLSSTQEQIWVCALGISCFWFDDPLFITFLVAPTLAAAGFTALMTATFVALLLFWFLCIADNARLEGAAGVRWRAGHAPRAAAYWIPKVILCTTIWAILLSLYVFQRIATIQDPSFTFADSFGPEYVAWGGRFIAGIGAIYVIYFFVLCVLAFRAFKATAPSTRYLLAVSVTTLILTLVGLFSQSFSATRNTTALFMASYGVPTVYIWSLLVLMRPAPAPADWSADTTGALGGAGDAADAEAPPPKPLSHEAFAALSPAQQWAAVARLQAAVAAGGGGGRRRGAADADAPPAAPTRAWAADEPPPPLPPRAAPRAPAPAPPGAASDDDVELKLERGGPHAAHAEAEPEDAGDAGAPASWK